MPLPSGSSSHERRQLGIPVARAAELRLEAAGGGRDHGALVVGRPVGLVVVVELDAAGRGEARRDVAAVEDRVEAVVLVPGVVERGLVLVAAGREGEGALPDVVGRVVGEVRRGAGRIPVAGAARLRLQRPGDRDRGRIGRRRRGGEQDEPQRGKRDHHRSQHPHSVPAHSSELLLTFGSSPVAARAYNRMAILRNRRGAGHPTGDGRLPPWTSTPS